MHPRNNYSVNAKRVKNTLESRTAELVLLSNTYSYAYLRPCVFVAVISSIQPPLYSGLNDF